MKTTKQYLVIAIVLLILTGCSTRPEADFIPPAIDIGQPWTDQAFKNDPMDFQFAIVSDRTGGMRPGVFRKAVTQLNLLQPEFVMSVGDLIEGYTENYDTLKQQHDEIDEILSDLDMRFFWVAGNHELTCGKGKPNDVIRDMYHERCGRPYYHFVYKDVLFLVLSTDDPTYGNVSDTQVNYIRKVLKDNMNVRWTFVFFHAPYFYWDEEDRADGYVEIVNMLKSRPHTAFAGHAHRYKKVERHGQTYIGLATTGGGSKLRGVDFGEFDHIVWVTMTDNGPRIANLMLDGIYDENIEIAE